MTAYGDFLRKGVLVCSMLAFLGGLTAAGPALADPNSDPAPIQLLSPAPDSLSISKKPLIRCRIGLPHEPGQVLVLLDGSDLTDLARLTPDGFELSPLGVLPAGEHTLTVVLTTPDGGQIEKAFNFSTRHYENMKEFYNKGELTAVYTGLLHKSREMVEANDNKVEANLSNDLRAKEGDWEMGLRFNLRYMDQSLPVALPEKKGINIADYLLEFKFSRNDLMFLTNLGDLTVEESRFTASGLARRGGKVELEYQGLALHAFVVNSNQYYGFEGGPGLDSDTNDHIMGGSAKLGLMDDRMRFKVIYLTGGQAGDSFGQWEVDAQSLKKGDVWGLVFETDFFEQVLVSEVEVAFSHYDRDTADQEPYQDDNSYRLALHGAWQWLTYEAGYEYLGPNFLVVGNDSLLNDRAGFFLRSGIQTEVHSLNLAFSQYYDNVEQDETLPQVFIYQGSLDYSYTGIESLPLALSYQKTVYDSRDEPLESQPKDTNTDVITATISYTGQPWSVNLQGTYSVEDDRVDSANDTSSTTVSLAPSYFDQSLSFAPSFSFNRVKYEQSGIYTDTYTINLDLRGTMFSERLSFGLAGTYNRIEASDRSLDQDTITADAEIKYLLVKDLAGHINPSIGIQGQYSYTKDRLLDEVTDEFRCFLVFSLGLPYSF